MKVYKDPLLSGNTLMGYKGQSVMDCGYFYAPYIPLTSTPVVLNPGDYEPLEEPSWSKDRKPSYRSIDDPWEVSSPDES